VDLNQWLSSVSEIQEEKERNADLRANFEIAAVSHALVANETRGSGRSRDRRNQRIRETVIGPRDHSEA
jgi:hypothetical protein